MTSSKKRWALVGAGLGLAASVSAAAIFFELPMSTTATAASTPAQAPAVPVTVALVASRDVTTWQEFSGRLEAVDRVQIRSRVAGAIQAVHFREGALVKAGDLLFTIDPEPYQAAVSRGRGRWHLPRRRSTSRRSSWNAAAGSQTTRRFRKAISISVRMPSLKRRPASAPPEAALRSAQLELGYTEVHAPVAGRVGKIEITVGNLVAAGSTSPALTTLVSVDPIYASFNASEEMVTKALAELPAADGAVPAVEQIPVEVGTLADQGTPIKGKLQLIDNQVDAASGTIGVRAVFDNPGGKLIPGQFVRVRMGEPKAENKILISDRAIGTDQDKKFVFVVDADNKVSYRPVQLGAAAEGQRIVESGLTVGDKIVVNGLQRIRPGAVVAPQAEEKVATAQ